MGWMSWQDFDVDSALQRDTLGRALPLVETESAEDWGDRINMADPHDPGLTTVLVDSIVNGATPESRIDLLQLRPLLFGTAWTVLDLLLEEALTAAGAPPDQSGGRWSIREKARQARASAGRPSADSARCWQALTLTLTYSTP